MKPWIPSTKRTATPPRSGPGKSSRAIQNQIPYASEHGREQRADGAERDPDPLDRLRPEAGEHVQREPRQAERRVARAAGACRVADVDLDDRGAAGEDQRLRELLLADRAEHRGDGAAPVGVEGAAEVGDRHAGEAAQHPVDQARGKRAAPGVVARGAAAARDVGPVGERGDEPRDVLGLVLEVAVHRHDDLAAGAREAGVHRRVLAEVALEADGADARVGGVQPLDDRPGAVARAVVDEDELEAAPVERRHDPAVELLERARLVVERDDDRELRRRPGLACDEVFGAAEDVDLGHRSRRVPSSARPTVSRDDGPTRREDRRRLRARRARRGVRAATR